jgi:hypothetical protein
VVANILLVAASLAIASILLRSPTFAQTAPQAPTGNVVTIATANKFQQVVPATSTKRQALTIKNNNSDNCWLFIGSDKASKDNSIALDPGGSYVRFSNRPVRVKRFQTLHDTGSMSLAGSCFSTDSALRPFHHGIRRRGGTIF